MDIINYERYKMIFLIWIFEYSIGVASRILLRVLLNLKSNFFY